MAEDKSRKRIVSFDVIRLFSCLCVTIVHFNATVSGYNGTFVYPNSIIPNFYIESRIYLGGIGVSLFFILSGATLMYTYKKGLKNFYIKRFKSLLPMFWIAFIVTTLLDFMHYKGMSLSSPLLLVFSVLGMDGYLGALGLIPMAFYKVGEWFLGCIILLYIIFPLLHYCLEKCPVGTCLVVFSGYAVIFHFFPQLNSIWFFMRIPEVLLGALVVKYKLYDKPGMSLLFGSILFLAGYIFRNSVNPLTFNVAFCCLIFGLLTFISQFIKNEMVISEVAKFANLTYPIFLVHHWLSFRLIEGFALDSISKRYVLILFIIYIYITFLLSKLLVIAERKIMELFTRRVGVSLR